MRGKPFGVLTALAVPLLRNNVNTDAIIPSREMKTVGRAGLADGLFADWRYRNVGGRDPDPDFVLNDPKYAGAQILLAGANFGCGSSREHAAWALAEYGFRAIVAESFNPIFRNNATLNGIVAAILPKASIQLLAQQIPIDLTANAVTIDLDRMTIIAVDGTEFHFTLDAETRAMLREGLDAIDLTMKRRGDIEAFRAADRLRRPWAYG